MTIALELEPGVEQEAARMGLTPEELAKQAMRTLIDGLKRQRILQSLDEMKPRLTPPPGKTAMQMVYQQIPADESDEEVRRVLEELS